MSLGPLIIAIAVATAVPLIVLYVIYTLDLYGTGSFKTVALCFVWGGLMVGAAFIANTDLYDRIGDFDTMVRFVAPIVEELLKAAILVYLVRQKNFTYFVDGAIYGFAVGIGFAVFENYFYLAQSQNEALSIAIGRVLSTNLMHAAASAVVGSALGFARFQRFRGRAFFLVAGLVTAMAFHMGFNNLTQSDAGGGLLLLYAAVIGFGGTGFIAWVIFGALAGWLAGKLAGDDDGSGCLTNIIVGIVGAFVGGIIYKLISGEDWDFAFNIPSFAVAVGGSVVLLVLLRMVRR